MRDTSKIKDGLIISCQALPDEPLHSPFIMGRMAKAADESGAVGIRANSVEDIIEIRKNTKLPIIGIIKANYSDSNVFITPTIKEADELLAINVEIIAIDATLNLRPNGEKLEDIVKHIRDKNPKVEIMADCSKIEDVYNAEKLGFDYVGTTLFGVNEETRLGNIYNDDMKDLKEIISNVSTRLIVEGGIDTPELAVKVKALKPYSMVVGSAITRPQFIAKRFIEKLKEVN